MVDLSAARSADPKVVRSAELKAGLMAGLRADPKVVRLAEKKAGLMAAS